MTIIHPVFYFEGLMVVTGSLIMNMRNTAPSLVEETGSTEFWLLDGVPSGKVCVKLQDKCVVDSSNFLLVSLRQDNNV